MTVHILKTSCGNYFYVSVLFFSFILGTGSFSISPLWERNIWGLCGKFLVYNFDPREVEEIVHHTIAETSQSCCNHFHISAFNDSAYTVTNQTKFPLWDAELFFLILLVLIPRYVEQSNFSSILSVFFFVLLVSLDMIVHNRWLMLQYMRNPSCCHFCRQAFWPLKSLLFFGG